MNKILKTTLGILGKLAVVGFACFLLLYAYLFLMIFLSTSLDYFFGLLSFLLPLLVVAIAWFIPNEKGKKITLKASAALALACVLAMGVIFARDRYLASIRFVDNSNINTEEYLPFDENSKIARLDEESTLKFKITDKLPIVDGAAALFPMYSAFVNATYPSNIKDLNHTDSPFQYNNTTYGYSALIRGETDIFFGAYPSEYQLVEAELAGVELEFIPMGAEGFIFFTNSKNPIDSLTCDEVRAIYSGTITNWKEVGGENLAIQAFQRNNGSGSQSALIRFMEGTPLMTPPSELVFSLMSGIITQVSDYENHRGAIGFSFYNYASVLQANANIKILALDGIYPSVETIGSGTYPVTDSFYMVVRKDNRTENINKLIEWVLSPQGQELVQKSGYTPIK